MKVGIDQPESWLLLASLFYYTEPVGITEGLDMFIYHICAFEEVADSNHMIC